MFDKTQAWMHARELFDVVNPVLTNRGQLKEKLCSKLKRSWVGPVRLLVYAARDWCGTKRWQNTSIRDAPMISRFHTAYAEKTGPTPNFGVLVSRETV